MQKKGADKRRIFGCRRVRDVHSSHHSGHFSFLFNPNSRLNQIQPAGKIR